MLPAPTVRSELDSVDVFAVIASAQPADVPEEPPSLEEARSWLQEWGLLNGKEDDQTILRRHAVLSRCNFGSGVLNRAKRRFL